MWFFTGTHQDLSHSVEVQGGRLRAESKWLKGQSFVIQGDILLKYIQSEDILVRPVAKGRLLKSRGDSISLLNAYQNIQYGLSAKQLKTIGVDKVHDAGYFGSGITIGVFDTGFDSTHPAIKTIFESGRVVASHDFNSGDHIYSEIGNPPPPMGSEPVYINSFSSIKQSDTLYRTVYSVIGRDSLLHQNFFNWRLYQVDLRVINGQIFLQQPIHLQGLTGRPIQPDLERQNDTTSYLVYQAASGVSYDIFFTKVGPDGILQPPLNLSNDLSPSLDPVVLAYDSLVSVLWFDQDSGIYMSNSYNYGETFESRTLIAPFPHPAHEPGKLEGDIGWVFENGLYIALTYEYEDTVNVVVVPLTLGSTLHEVVGPGHDPDVSLYTGIDNFTAYISYWNDTTLYLAEYDGADLTVNDLYSAPYIKNPTLAVVSPEDVRITASLGNLIVEFSRSGDILDTVGSYGGDYPEYVDTVLFWRQRGDRSVSPDGMVPGFQGGPNYHGTRVLSVLAGFDQTNGMVGPALGSKFILCKTEINKVQDQTFEFQIEEDFWVEALEFAADRGAKIISSSLGYRDWYVDEDMNGVTPITSRAASMAVNKNVLVVTAIGNITDQSYFPDPIAGDTSLVAPADAFEIVAVGGYETDSTTGSLVPVSLYGPTADGRIKPEVIAPFSAYCATLETNQGDTLPFYYAICHGTSFSTPLVAGALATVWEAHPSWDAKKLRRVILKTAKPITDIPGYSNVPDSNNITGWGLLNAYAALNYEPPEVASGFSDILLDPYPNPVNLSKGELLHIPFNLAHSTYVQIKIFSIEGTLVYSANLGIKPPGRYRTAGGFFPDFVWNGKTNSGKLAAPGLYLIVLNTGFNTSIKKFAVIR